jgi:putative DNA primase/helicase
MSHLDGGSALSVVEIVPAAPRLHLVTPPPADKRAAAPTGQTADRTDLRNAECLIEWLGADLRFVGTWSKGLAWDGTRWELDDVARWQQAAASTARTLFEDAITELKAANNAQNAERMEKARGALAWAAKSQGAPRLAAMVTLGRSFPSVIVKHTALDSHPWLLNVRNGTFDLRTGKLGPHQREHLITKLAPVEYDSRATAPTWEAFLERAMGGNPELVEFLQRLIGYALTGEVREHVLAFFHGDGANGKSTFLATIHAMLGDYATPAARKLLFRGRSDRHPTELATLYGRRFVTCSEIEEGLAFDEALVKDLTGGDRINARRMQEDEWSFDPTHKLFLAGNHKPSVRGDDEGIWRRMRLVPWDVVIPEGERDPELPTKLRAELAGVLRWSVEGCLAWQRHGLDAPTAVRAATREYREENDLLGQFFRDYLVFAPDATVSRRELRETYGRACQEAGTEPLGAKRFAARLRERGVTETTVRGEPRLVNGTLMRPVVHAWRGVRFATDEERACRTDESCSHVATCSDQSPASSQTPAHGSTNPEPPATSGYSDTNSIDEQDTFAAYVNREGICE